MIHGHSTIELTDVKTGEVERYEDDNIVTNGLKHYLESHGDNITSLNFVCIWKEFFGGIKLFDTMLDENVETLNALETAEITGYAGKTADTANTKRGLLNLSESGVLDDQSGIRLVWDFAQSQANGTIACIGIVPPVFVDNSPECEIRLLSQINLGDPGIPSGCKPVDYNGKTRMLLFYNSPTKNSVTTLCIKKIRIPAWEHSITDTGNFKSVEIPLSPEFSFGGYKNFFLAGKDEENYYFLLRL